MVEMLAGLSCVLKSVEEYYIPICFKHGATIITQLLKPTIEHCDVGIDCCSESYRVRLEESALNLGGQCYR